MNIDNPILIRQLAIKNRLVLPPMAIAKAGYAANGVTPESVGKKSAVK